MNALNHVAEEYVLLSHRLNKHCEGLVDAHYGKASELKSQVDGEPLIALNDLLADAENILRALDGDISERANYLRKQTTALKTIIEKKQGKPISFRDEARLCYGISTIECANELELLDAIREIDERLDPSAFGDDNLPERFVKWRSRFELKGDELIAFVLAVMKFAKEKTESLFPLPENAVEVSLVTDKPWAGYHWYRGNYRSLYELNADVPTTIWGVLHTTTHETFCGHHAEAVVKESELTRKRGFIEFGINLLGAPHSLVSEGLAESASFVIVGDSRAIVEWLRENQHLHRRSISDNDARLIELVEELGRQPIVNAALLMHDENASDDEVFSYLRQFLPSEDALIRRAISRLRDDDFRAYMLTYPIGKAMIMNELDRSPNPAQTFYDILKSVDYQFNANPN
ncbi:MAG: hypothetical protein NZM06_03025 [Chloroherpetonaceae bacterium]|nr:hypothetical protein [Chloroherpetonaceae bacterium]MDW8438465.1 hypothetical protein [Chloroherpetonaceae bacterium]